MHITITETGDPFCFDPDYHTYEIRLTDDVDCEMELFFVDGEPEDRFMFRAFKDVYKIEKALKFAWHAGRRGEELTITKDEVE